MRRKARFQQALSSQRSFEKHGWKSKRELFLEQMEEGRDRAVARNRKQAETDAARRQQEEALVSGLRVELRALRATYPDMSLLSAVEYITSDPAYRIALYRRCSAEDRSIIGMVQDDSRPLTMASSVAKDLALLDRRAKAEGFQV